ncbi:MAG TPA: sensor domain-containing diguanylate cyclase [Thermoanaerobaculia bacterium]|nr:sensor domain-containing diguanylate cyclase [Thermoanaerobaculia bacterium]
MTASPRRRHSSKDEVRVHSLDPQRLDRFLERRRSARTAFPSELSLAENLTAVLRKANEFVPSAAGSILLDDPAEKLAGPPGAERSPAARRGSADGGGGCGAGRLTFIAAFGERSAGLVGREIPADRGIAGHVYLSGTPYRTSDAAGDCYFYGAVDRSTHYTTRSVIAIPIRIEQTVCGVLELINREGADNFTLEDEHLLEIFAGYISISIQNVLDGRAAHEIAKRDNLTGLYNDRYLHVAVTRALTDCRHHGRDLAVLFLDLDYFKRVNDTHGHLAGSQVLREVGELLARHADDYGALPARYGGDEFVLVVPGADLDRAVDLAEDIRGEIAATTFVDGPGEVHPEPLGLRGLTCSIGIATLARHAGTELPDDQTRSSLLRLADAAMYVAKETGRNRTAVAGEPVRRRH